MRRFFAVPNSLDHTKHTMEKCMTELSFQYTRDVDHNRVDQLACILFEGSGEFVVSSNSVSTGLALLSPEICCEKVYSSGSIIKQKFGDLEYAYSSHFLWVSCRVDESRFDSLVAATEFAYAQLLETLSSTGYTHLVRVWNYFERINEEEAGLERYKRFCVGRFNAFQLSRLDQAFFPSACALGHSGGNLVVYALASKIQPVHFENPNQQSAYFYPAEYGPRSPSFARASAVKLDDKNTLVFISGTASVLGHKTVYPFDVDKQLAVTFDNLDLLVSQIQKEYASALDLVPALLKVYIRHPHDLALIQQAVNSHYPGVDAVYLKADICRADLMLEIDGVWNLSLR
jgi:chorismate lyase / 3-hydroxybenzoate synthase